MDDLVSPDHKDLLDPPVCLEFPERWAVRDLVAKRDLEVLVETAVPWELPEHPDLQGKRDPLVTLAWMEDPVHVERLA